MVSLASLWLPVVLAAVAVFVASSILHMALPWHRSDYRGLPAEDDALAALGRQGLVPGLYQFPHCGSPKEMGTPEMKAKFERGPVGLLAVMPSGTMSLGKFLGAWMGYCLLVSVFLAYLASLTLPRGTDPLLVFRVVGSTAILVYSVSNAVDSIWRAYPWRVTAKHMLDGLVYALIAGAIFTWLWPR